MPEPTAGRAFAYRAFISYSHADKAWADWLHKSLETYRVPSRLVGTATAHGTVPRRLNPIFRDRDELASAAMLGRKINEALGESANLIVICSPASAASRWVNEEVLAFKRLGRDDQIFCLIVDGEPNAADACNGSAEECFCPALRFNTGADCQLTTERVEPIAADVRPGKDGKANAKLKLVAGILDLGFDALKQREQHRKVRRMAAVTAFALVVMAVTTVLAVLALISRHDAVVAQHKAIAAEHVAIMARDDANRRQAQAQDILGFMLGDLQKKLATVGRLDLLRSVDDKATAYFAMLKPRDLTDTTLEQQARLLMDIGQVRLAEGELPGATTAFQEALARTSALYTRAPGNGNRLFDKAQAEYWVGFAAMQKGDDATADTMFTSYYRSAVKLAAMNRNNFAWQKEVAYGLQAVAVMDKTLGRTAEAERGMQEQLVLYHDWLKQRPGDPQLRDEAGNVVSWLGSLALEQGQLARAESYFSEQVRDLQQNMTVEANNIEWKDAGVDALALLANVQEQRGELGPARANLASSTALAKAMYGHDPENNNWRLELGLCHLSQSELDALNKPRKALEKAELAESLIAAAHAKDPKGLRATQSLVRVRNQLAQLALARGDIKTAEKDVAGSLAVIGPAWNASSIESFRVKFAEAWALKGEIAQRQGRNDVARSAWSQARELLIAGTRPEIPFDRLDPLVRVLQLLGRNAEAAPYLQRLTASGYVPLHPWPNAVARMPAVETRAPNAGGTSTLMALKTPALSVHGQRDNRTGGRL